MKIFLIFITRFTATHTHAQHTHNTTHTQIHNTHNTHTHTPTHTHTHTATYDNWSVLILTCRPSWPSSRESNKDFKQTYKNVCFYHALVLLQNITFIRFTRCSLVNTLHPINIQYLSSHIRQCHGVGDCTYGYSSSRWWRNVVQWEAASNTPRCCIVRYSSGTL
jgi:hypothetical protein